MRSGRGFLFLLGLLASLYIVAWAGEGLRRQYLGFDWLPSLARLPFGGGAGVRAAAPSLPDSVHKQVEAVESLHAAMEQDDAPQPSPTAVETSSTAARPIASQAPATSQTGNAAPPAEGVKKKARSQLKSPPLVCNEEGWAQLGAFFSHLRKAHEQGAQVRIMHYGDSQVEGDRISSYIRGRLQKAFGGRGVGLVSAVPPVYPPHGLRVDPAEAWRFYSMMPAARRKATLQYGPMGSLSRFERQLYAKTDSSRYVGEIRIRRKLQSGNGMRFTHCKAFLNTHAQACQVTMWLGDSLVSRQEALRSSAPQVVTLPVPERAEQFALRFESTALVDVLGLSYETPSGVQMDNLPLRGSSGTDFGAIGDTMFYAIHALLQPRLILLQFGVNMVPSRLGSYAFYKRRFKEEIARMRLLLPDCAFVVLGVSDMAEKREESFASYPNVRLVRNAQREAALESGVAFWDCFEAMGGENSIVSWVNANPPLATADYVHFTPRGARYVGELFYAALMEAYERHLGENGASEEYAE